MRQKNTPQNAAPQSATPQIPELPEWPTRDNTAGQQRFDDAVHATWTKYRAIIPGLNAAITWIFGAKNEAATSATTATQKGC